MHGSRRTSLTTTSQAYRLCALPDGKRPALIRDPKRAAAIEADVRRLPSVAVGEFLVAIVPPLRLGAELKDGRWVKGSSQKPSPRGTLTTLARIAAGGPIVSPGSARVHKRGEVGTMPVTPREQ